MDPIEELEREYDRMLREHVHEVRDYLEEHRAALKRHGIHAAGFQFPLRPLFFSRSQLQHIEHCVQIFWSALLKTFQLEFGGDARRIAGLLQLSEPIQECLERYFTPELEFTQLFGRADGFTWGGNVKFIEQNITSGPGGLATIDALSRFFEGFPAVRALREKLPVERLSPIDAYVSLFSSPRFVNKSIGYVDAIDPDTGGLWDDDGLRFLEVLAGRGVHLINLTGRELSLREDGVYADGRRLDFIYRGVAAIGLWFRLEELMPLFQACGKHQTEMILTPFEMVFFDKMLLPYLSDEQLNSFLSLEERRVLSGILPWTRFVREYTTAYRGHQVRIPEFCLRARSQLVLKKGNGFGSEAVVMGAECTNEQWKEHVDKGLNEGNWIVQELVDPPRVSLPYLQQGALGWSEALSMVCPYVVRGKVSGIASRTSVPEGGRILVGAGAEGSRAGIRTAFCLD